MLRFPIALPPRERQPRRKPERESFLWLGLGMMIVVVVLFSYALLAGGF